MSLDEKIFQNFIEESRDSLMILSKLSHDLITTNPNILIPEYPVQQKHETPKNKPEKKYNSTLTFEQEEIENAIMVECGKPVEVGSKKFFNSLKSKLGSTPKDVIIETYEKLKAQGKIHL